MNRAEVRQQRLEQAVADRLAAAPDAGSRFPRHQSEFCGADYRKPGAPVGP
jgi:hypothetical protein